MMSVIVIIDNSANFFPSYSTYVEVGFCKIDIIIIGDNGVNFNGMTNVLCDGVNIWKGFFSNLHQRGILQNWHTPWRWSGCNFSGAKWTHKGDYFHQMFVMSNNIKNWAWPHYNFIVGTCVPLPSFPYVSFSCILRLALVIFSISSPTFISIIPSSHELHHCCKCFQVMF